MFAIALLGLWLESAMEREALRWNSRWHSVVPALGAVFGITSPESCSSVTISIWLCFAAWQVHYRGPGVAVSETSPRNHGSLSHVTLSRCCAALLGSLKPSHCFPQTNKPQCVGVRPEGAVWEHWSCISWAEHSSGKFSRQESLCVCLFIL